MADLSRHLPLSNRPRGDESGVTGDRRHQLAEVVRQAHLLSAGAPDAVEGFLREARLDGELPGMALPEIADALDAGARRGIRPLTEAVAALLRLAGPREVALDPLTSGAVALYAVTRTPRDRRAVVGTNTLRATDAGWEFGHGPVRAASARQILDFLLGLGDVPPPLSPR